MLGLYSIESTTFRDDWTHHKLLTQIHIFTWRVSWEGVLMCMMQTFSADSASAVSAITSLPGLVLLHTTYWQTLKHSIHLQHVNSSHKRSRRWWNTTTSKTSLTPTSYNLRCTRITCTVFAVEMSMRNQFVTHPSSWIYYRHQHSLHSAHEILEYLPRSPWIILHGVVTERNWVRSALIK